MADETEADRIQVLRSLLEAAGEVVRSLQDDAVFARLVDVFRRMPEGDREVIVAVLEREIQTRLLSQEVADSLTQVRLRPKPNARLYFRVVEPEEKNDDVEMLAFLRAAYSVQRGIDALDPQWRTLIVMALQQMDPAAREQIDGFNRAMRILLDEAARDAARAQEERPEPPDEAPKQGVSSRKT